MSLLFASINSGSNGNCYFVGTHQEAVLIDAGISCREIEKRMKQLQLPVQAIRAIFISHEHSDHTRGVGVLSRKHNIPVYISEKTHLNSGLFLEKKLINHFYHRQVISFEKLTVACFSKQHDAADPYSFNVSAHGLTVGVFTDIGTPCDNLIHHFTQCHAAFLEANYDEHMLDNGAYPYHLKQRIKSNTGHLSNYQALELFTKHKAPHLKHLVLSHLSKENNTPELVYNLFKQHAGNVHIDVASRYEAGKVYMAGIDEPAITQMKKQNGKSGFGDKNPMVNNPAQTRLF